MFEAYKKGVDILLVQEHNLTPAHDKLVRRTANERGFYPCVGFVQNCGGSAIFASMHTFPVPPPPDACIASMSGRITKMTLERQADGRACDAGHLRCC